MTKRPMGAVCYELSALGTWLTLKRCQMDTGSLLFDTLSLNYVSIVDALGQQFVRMYTDISFYRTFFRGS